MHQQHFISIFPGRSAFYSDYLGLQFLRNSFGPRLILHIINYIVLNVKYILHFVYYIFLKACPSGGSCKSRFSEPGQPMQVSSCHQQETCMGAAGILGISLYFLGGIPTTFLNAREK